MDQPTADQLRARVGALSGLIEHRKRALSSSTATHNSRGRHTSGGTGVGKDESAHSSAGSQSGGHRGALRAEAKGDGKSRGRGSGKYMGRATGMGMRRGWGKGKGDNNGAGIGRGKGAYKVKGKGKHARKGWGAGKGRASGSRGRGSATVSDRWRHSVDVGTVTRAGAAKLSTKPNAIVQLHGETYAKCTSSSSQKLRRHCSTAQSTRAPAGSGTGQGQGQDRVQPVLCTASNVDAIITVAGTEYAKNASRNALLRLSPTVPNDTAMATKGRRDPSRAAAGAHAGGNCSNSNKNTGDGSKSSSSSSSSSSSGFVGGATGEGRLRQNEQQQEQEDEEDDEEILVVPSSRSEEPETRVEAAIPAFLRKPALPAKAQPRFCVFFTRFGRCKKGAHCPNIHDPSKVAVCRAFLCGECTDPCCPLSHIADPAKMPVCAAFLRGLCTDRKCPFSHVKVQRGAAICPAFLTGHCPLGNRCTLMHSRKRSRTALQRGSDVVRVGARHNADTCGGADTGVQAKNGVDKSEGSCAAEFEGEEAKSLCKRRRRARNNSNDT